MRSRTQASISSPPFALPGITGESGRLPGESSRLPGQSGRLPARAAQVEGVDNVGDHAGLNGRELDAGDDSGDALVDGFVVEAAGARPQNLSFRRDGELGLDSTGQIGVNLQLTLIAV